MIDDLDLSLAAMLAGEALPASELANATITFAAPDKDWRAQGTGLELDVYLYKLLENRELRSLARRRRREPDGTVTDEQFPIRTECSYLITAWDKESTDSPAKREQLEHRLLGQVLYVLWRNPTIPRKYLLGVLANTQEIDPPVVSAQSDDLAVVPDFWTGLETYLRPAVTCRITLSLDLKLDVTGPMVRALDIRCNGDELFTIGGTVRTALPGSDLVAGCWIRVDELGRVSVTDEEGRFLVDGIAPGGYTLRARAVGFQEGVLPVTVPQPNGNYDLTLSPL